METLLNSCQRLSNVTIRCRDGLVSSHKIILAGVSPCIKRILSGIPVGDEVTVIMPDFESSQLHTFLVALWTTPSLAKET